MGGICKGAPAAMKLASLKGPTRDGTLAVVNRALTRAVKADGIAATMQYALENWDAVAPRLRDIAAALDAGNERHALDFQDALARGRVAAPLPRAYEWLDGSAYLSHVERVRRARNDKVPESFYKDPLMYQGGAGDMMGPRDPIRVISEEWGVDLEGEVAAIVGERRVVPPPHPGGAREGLRLRERQGRERARARRGDARRAGRELGPGARPPAPQLRRERRAPRQSRCGNRRAVRAG
jgi:hypothetical protein